MATIQLPQDFKEFLQFLNGESVEYLVIGGYAVGIHGYVRATGDFDVWIAVSPINAAATLSALEKFGFGRAAGATEEMFLEQGRIIQMGVPPFRIDIVNRISGVEFAECYARRVIVQLESLEVPVISLEDLKKNKAASGRLKDLADLESLS